MAISSVVLISIISLLCVLLRRKRANLGPYPPGPKPRLLIGNLLDVPKVKPWKTYKEWSKTYRMVNTKDLSDRMFAKQARIYSDRPYIPMLELSGWEIFDAGFMPYGDIWRKHRRLYQQSFRPDITREYLPIQSSKNAIFISNLHEDLANFMAHIRTSIRGSSDLAAVYGYNTTPTNDHFVDIAEESLRMLSEMYSPTAAIVNVFPILRHLPLFLPIFEFQRVAVKSLKLLREMQEAPFQYVKSGMRSGSGNSSLLARLLERNDTSRGDKDQELAIQGACATAYADRRRNRNFLPSHGDVSGSPKESSAELDNVFGIGFKPGYEERPNLPYIEAVFRETLRWSPVTPLGLYKASFEENVVDGFYIPKGATVISNIWAMSRDETIYHNPELFNPERFLKDDGTCISDDSMWVFGAGRRICPGRRFASATLWLAITSILVEFGVGKPKTLDGEEVRSLEDVNYSDGFLR
ncbi:hypothetical protein V5O48_017583 [Marasmius crinis-equi]|uniref:Cytochrome P450 n=1 Tax=Marasmius crinis-equi TaxID=585013 RepID=A0ABR3ENJ1_9AGAR